MNTELVSNPTGQVAGNGRSNPVPTVRPDVDIIELDNELVLKADMPGADADSVSLDYEKGQLTLRASIKRHQAPSDRRYLAQEYRAADFHREFLLGDDIDADKISAEYKNGLLTVHLPKAETAKPRKIEIKAAH